MLLICFYDEPMKTSTSNRYVLRLNNFSKTLAVSNYSRQSSRLTSDFTPDYAAVYVAIAGFNTIRESLTVIIYYISRCYDEALEPGQTKLNKQNRKQLCKILREVVPAPDHEWHILSPSQGGGLNQPDGRTVRLDDNAVSLAASIDARQAFELMPILADALEESGITDATMLQHCREDREHMPGCWVLDLVLGRQ